MMSEADNQRRLLVQFMRARNFGIKQWAMMLMEPMEHNQHCTHR